MVQLTSEQQAMFMQAAPRTFVPVPGGLGWLRATNVVLVCANEAIVESALVVAWRNIVPISRVKSTDLLKIDGEIVDGDEGEQCEGIAKAKAAGVYKGRQASIDISSARDERTCSPG